MNTHQNLLETLLKRLKRHYTVKLRSKFFYKSISKCFQQISK